MDISVNVTDFTNAKVARAWLAFLLLWFNRTNVMKTVQTSNDVFVTLWGDAFWGLETAPIIREGAVPELRRTLAYKCTITPSPC